MFLYLHGHSEHGAVNIVIFGAHAPGGGRRVTAWPLVQLSNFGRLCGHSFSSLPNNCYASPPHHGLLLRMPPSNTEL